MGARILLHVNYVEQGQTIEEMCAFAARLGCDGIEFRRERKNVPETREQYLDSIARAYDRFRLREASFGYPAVDLMQPDPAARRKEIEDYAAFIEMAVKRLPVRVLNAFTGPLMNPDKSIPYSDYTKHGSFTATDDHYAWAAEGYRELGRVGQELGVRFAFETHMCYLHDVPASTRKLLDMIAHPAVGANLDYVNIFCIPGQPSLEETVAMLSDRIYDVHLKNTCRLDSGGFLRCVGLGDGEVNNRELLRLLKRCGYDGPLCIEAPRPGDREWFGRQDMAYLRTILADLGY